MTGQGARGTNTSSAFRFAALREGIQRILFVPLQSKQGRHIDPAEVGPVVTRDWPKDQRAVWFSAEMEMFRQCLRIADQDVREAILDDLSKYYGYSPEECVVRCLHWEKWSVREWQAGDRNTREGLQAFYDSVQSWSFDLLWYSYLQACGYGFPASVLAVRFAQQHCPGGSHLDLGSGIGVTSQLFGRLGFSSTLADVSKPLLEFAHWRLDRRGDRARALNLTSTEIPTAAYDIVTAIDTLGHVPDFDATVRDIHRAIRPGGWLLTNLNVREKGADESAWHFYDNAIELEHRLIQAGFMRLATPPFMIECYQRGDLGSRKFRTHAIRSQVTLPGKLFWAAARRVRWPTPSRLARAASRAVRAMRTER